GVAAVEPRKRLLSRIAGSCSQPKLYTMERLIHVCLGRSWTGRFSCFFGAVLGSILVFVSDISTADSLRKMTAETRVRQEGEPWRYFLFLPSGYTDSELANWPMVLWLHGRSLRGDDLEQLRRYGPPSFLEKRPDFPFVVICPQLPDGSWPAEGLNRLLDECLETYRIDEDRIILTGDSLGAMGAWTFAGMFPNRFAALSPVTAHGPMSVADRLTHLPIRAWHGDSDEAVPMEPHVELIEKIQSLGGDAKIKIIKDGTHASVIGMNWRDPEWLDWIERQRREPDE
ncbi:MAG: hypothetical protein AAF357_15155, partial [Verrucomicrobiota bacterium]